LLVSHTLLKLINFISKSSALSLGKLLKMLFLLDLFVFVVNLE
jgi:hypothetical protein